MRPAANRNQNLKKIRISPLDRARIYWHPSDIVPGKKLPVLIRRRLCLLPPQLWQNKGLAGIWRLTATPAQPVCAPQVRIEANSPQKGSITATEPVDFYCFFEALRERHRVRVAFVSGAKGR
jgi:hypothetical protein